MSGMDLYIILYSSLWKLHPSFPLSDISSVSKPATIARNRKEPEFVTDEHSLQYYHTGASSAITGRGGCNALPPC